MAIEVINYASAAFAFGAAVLWFWSAQIEIPAIFNVVVDVSVSPSGEGSSGGSSVELQMLGDALKKQSRLSGWAARCAAASGVFMAIAQAI